MILTRPKISDVDMVYIYGLFFSLFVETLKLAKPNISDVDIDRCIENEFP